MKILFIIATILMIIFRPSSPVDVETVSSAAVVHDVALSSPVGEEKKIKVVTTALADIPSDEEWETISKYKNASIIAQIYQGESSFGKFDECRRRGLGWNGFGMMESVTRLKTIGPYCFNTFEDVVREVDAWIEREHAKGTSYAMMNCYYVTGYRVETCNTSYKLASNY